MILASFWNSVSISIYGPSLLIWPLAEVPVVEDRSGGISGSRRGRKAYGPLHPIQKVRCANKVSQPSYYDVANHAPYPVNLFHIAVI